MDLVRIHHFFLAVTRFVKEAAVRFLNWLDTPEGRQVLKCSLAYTLASLATFFYPLANFLGEPDGKHVVATITVYFHPARSAGSMIEAIIIATIAVTYAEAVSLLSMATSVFLGSTMRLVTVSHILVVIFIGSSFGLMGWVKQKMSNSLVNVGSTLASMAIIGVVTGENHVLSNIFSDEKLVQVFKMLVVGIVITTAVNLLIWPQSARKTARSSTSVVSASLAQILHFVIENFASASKDNFDSVEFWAIHSAYSTAYTRMMQDLRQARFEYYALGYETIFHNEKSVVESMEILAQSLVGLKNAAHTQLVLIHSILSEDRVSSPGTSQQTISCVFESFVTAISPSVVTLGHRLESILKGSSFHSQTHERTESEISGEENLRQSLIESLGTFNLTQAAALNELYRQIEITGRGLTETNKTNLEEVAAACGHFTFSLQFVGEEALKYLETIDSLGRVNRHVQRSWKWLLWWRATTHAFREPLLSSESPEFQESQEDEALMSPTVRPVESSNFPGVPAAQRNVRAIGSSLRAREVSARVLRKALWLFRNLAQDDRKFGIKVGIGAASWSMFSFIEATRGIYTHWKGEWGLLSFMIVCSMTVGDSNTAGRARFLGNVVGCLLSIISWMLSRGNGFMLVIFGWMVSLLTFYFIITRGKAPLGRMTLLAYNASTLYAYSLSQKANVDEDDSEKVGKTPDIVEITKHRALVVAAGILWGLIICRIIWPISGRRKFREGLSVLYLQIGLVWKRDPLAVDFNSQGSRGVLRSGEQVAMQRHAALLEELRQTAASEFDLIGPFPTDAYGRMLRATAKILDAFWTMSLVSRRNSRLTDAESMLLQHTVQERAALCHSICHGFEILASSMMLEYSLTDATTSIVVAREHLLSRIHQFRKDNLEYATAGERSGDNELESVTIGDRDYAILYAYVLVTGQVAKDIKLLSNEIGDLIGDRQRFHHLLL